MDARVLGGRGVRRNSNAARSYPPFADCVARGTFVRTERTRGEGCHGKTTSHVRERDVFLFAVHRALCRLLRRDHAAEEQRRDEATAEQRGCLDEGQGPLI